MPAELEIKEDGVASMFYAGADPWHGEGVKVASAVTSKEAAQLARIDWDVTLEPIFGANGMAIPDFRGVTRDIDEKVLGVVRSRYKPIQNSDAFSFLDSLVQDGMLLYNTAGTLFGGSKVWMLAEMPEGATIAGDSYKRYMLATTSHDGSQALTIRATQIRVVCNNTLMAATSGRAAASIMHAGDIGSQMAAARAALALTTLEHRKPEEWMTALAAVKTTEADVTKVQEAMFGPLDDATPTQRRHSIESFLAVYNEEREHSGETAYALANAITGYADHKIRITSKATRVQNAIDGPSAWFKKDAFKVLSEIAGFKQPVTTR